MPFDRYDVQEELGRGGNGVVYRARDTALGRDVALKVALRLVDAEAALRFEQEARALAQLQHPGIVGVHDFGRDPKGQPYLSLELLTGRSLQDWLEASGPLEPAAAARIVARFARALGYAHRQGVLHRDLKPANVMLEALDGQPVLTDFGLARLVDRETRLTQTGDLLGTPAFMSPEQANGERDRIGVRSDVYGLGAILYALLSGRPPFSGSNLVQVLRAVLKDPPEPLRRLRAGISPAIASVCERCLEKDPERRFASADEVADALEAAMEAPRRSGRWLFAAAGVAVVVAVGFGIKVLWPEPVGREGPVAAAPTPSVVPRAPVAREEPFAAAPIPALLYTVVIQPGALRGEDTFVRGDGSRELSNYGAEPELVIGSLPGPGNRGVAFSEVFMRFSLERIPKGAVVQRATLRLHMERGGGGRIPIVVHAVAKTTNASGYGKRQTPWREGSSLSNLLVDGVVWNGGAKARFVGEHPHQTRPRVRPRPRVEGEIPAPALGEGALVPWSIGVTPIVAGWVSGEFENEGLRITANPPSTSRQRERRERYCRSSDAARSEEWPRLTVVYRGRAPAPKEDREALWRTAQDDAEGIIAALPKVDPKAMSTPAELAEVARAVARAPFWGRVWFERGARLTRGCMPGHPYHREAHTALRNALTVARPYADREGLLRLRTEVAIRSRDKGRIEADMRLLEGLLRGSPPPKDPAALRRLVERARRALGAAGSR